MKRLLLITAGLLSLTCGMRNWEFNIPPRLLIYDILTIVFIVAWLIRHSRGAKGTLNGDLRLFLLLIWVYFTVEVVSGIHLISADAGEDSFVQYAKAIAARGAFAVFASCFCAFLSELRPRERNQILAMFIVGVALSSLYGMLGSVLFKLYGLRLEVVWDSLSYHTERRFDGSLTWAVMGIRRGIGFPGEGNSVATYNVTVLPLLLLGILYGGGIKKYLLSSICFLGLVVTLSRTGFIGFAVSLVAMLALSLKSVIRRGILRLSIFVCPVIAAAYVWRESIAEILKYRRFGAYNDRTVLWDAGLRLFWDAPLLGVGTNNYSVMRKTLPSWCVNDANLHNSWLTILVEVGLVGFVCYAFFLVFVICRTYRERDLLSKGFVCAIIGLAVAALGNQMFDLFYFKYFVTLMFAMIVLGDGSVQYETDRRRHWPHSMSALRQMMPTPA